MLQSHEILSRLVCLTLFVGLFAHGLVPGTGLTPPTVSKTSISENTLSQDPCRVVPTSQFNLPPEPPLPPPEQYSDPSASTPGDQVDRLVQDLQALANTAKNAGLTQMSVIIKDGSTGQVAQLNPDQLFESASLYKIFLLWKVQSEIKVGRLQDDMRIPLIQYNEDGTPPSPAELDTPTISVADARHLMITVSDNSAAWSLGLAVGWSEVDHLLRRKSFPVTTLGLDNPITTATEVTRFFEGVYNHTLDSDLGESDYNLMLDLFKDQQINYQLPAGLPVGTPFAHKTGNLDDFNHDAGIVFARDGRVFYITVLTKGDYEAGQAFMQEVARLSWQALGQKPLPRYFAITGKTVSGRFLQYWLSQGSLAAYGYPITEAHLEFNRALGRVFLTQWFERTRFEYHPENQGTPYEVLLGLLGNEICANALVADPRFQPAQATSLYFRQTGHNLGGKFLAYWQQNGAVARFGLPISEEHLEVDPETGQQYVVQWFERARFELHPENQGSPYEVLLGLLGKTSLKLQNYHMG